MVKTRHSGTLAALFVFLVTAAASAVPVRVGEVAPDFSLMDASGTTYTLSSFRGKVVLLGLIGYG